MQGLFASASFFEQHADELARIERETGASFERIAVPAEGVLAPEVAERIELAFFSDDVNGGPLMRRFYGVTRGAPRLRWMQVAHAGTDAPVYAEYFARGVRMTTSSGDSALPIAHSAIGGLLILARGFPEWLEAQRQRKWERRRDRLPEDLANQTLLLIGVGAIGNEIGRLARALGLHVIGVRRSPRRADDSVDELFPPSELPRLYPRAHWLAIACPLTDETRGLVDATAIAALPRGARVINIARGEVIDEAALTEALRDGRLGGAYLDVFQQEPLPAESAFWELPNVIVSPHDSAASAGNRARTDARFLRNLERWARGEALEQEVGREVG